jgi:hypothetical protein
MLADAEIQKNMADLAKAYAEHGPSKGERSVGFGSSKRRTLQGSRITHRPELTQNRIEDEPDCKGEKP